jgi:pre-mRNA cleavage complex 2 protein Pcf11
MEQGEDSNAAHLNLENADISCPAGPDDINRACDMCHDEFDTFYNNETEEWHLKSALKIDDMFYHPICYEDYKVRRGDLLESGGS